MTTKRNQCLRLALAAGLAASALAAHATVFFSDTFANGSTINSLTPANPTANSTAYEMCSSKGWSPTPSIAANDLKFGIASSSSGAFEIEALFATNAVALTQPNDYLTLTIVFTNTAGVLVNSGQLGVGMYNSGQVKPLPGGTNNATTAITLTGYAQNWQGYMAIMGGTGNGFQSYTRPQQSITTGNNQDLVSNGSGSSSYGSASTVGSAGTAGVTLTAGQVLTAVFTATLVDSTHLNITNLLYSGVGTGGTLLGSSGGGVSGTIVAGFDALGFGFRSRTAGPSNTLDVASINVSGSVTVITGPPTITQDPVNVTVATGGTCPFNVAANGFNMTYQWRRSGTNIANSSSISGATSTTLIVSNAGAGDQLSGANGYYCVVTGAGSFSTNSATAALALAAPKNLIWNGAGGNWDLANSANFNSAGNPATFNYGDAVTFDDTGAANSTVTLNSPFLSASKWLVTGSTTYGFNGPGYFAGPGQLIFNSSASGNIQLLTLTNIHTGGTVISNLNSALAIVCGNFQALGNGPLILAKTNVVEFKVSGSATTGVAGDVSVNDDFTFQFDGSGSFAGVLLGNISGVSGKTLFMNPQDITLTNRYRVYGTNTACNVGIALNASGNPTTNALYDGTVLATYQTAGVQTYSGVISGLGGLLVKNSGGANTILSSANNYSGGTTIASGSLGIGNNAALGTGQLSLGPDAGSASASGTIFASGGARTISNPLHYFSSSPGTNYTLTISGTNDLTFTANLDLNGLDNTGNPGSRTLTVNNTGATVFSGVISDSSAYGIGLVKNGSNTLYLNGANTFTGVTTNSGTGRLAGNGSVAGSVVVQTNAAIAGGTASAIGTFHIGGNLTFENGGGGYFRLNYPASDSVSVTGLITNLSTGTNIVVTNLGPALVAGNTFTLFNKAVTNGGNWTVTGGVGTGLGWTNKLGINGTIQVIQTMATYATNISYTVNGNGTVTVSWPATHLGWWLQGQTNQLNKGLGTNWTSIPGTSTVTSTNLPVVATNPAVFYRLSNTQ